MEFQALPVKRYVNSWQLTGNYIIAGDFHAPHHDVTFCNRILRISRQLGIKRLVIAGDGLDMNAFSPWGADPESSWSQEMKFAAQWLWVLYNTFDEIRWIRGNHCDRLARATNWQMTAEKVIDAILCHYVREELGKPFTFEPDKLQLSNYPFCFVDDYMIVHPKSYSRIPGRIANQIAMIRGCNVVCAHAHRAYKGVADDGKHVIADMGAMCDPEVIAYQNLSVTTHPRWNKGFCTYTDEHLEVWGEEPFTMWSKIENGN